MENSQFLMNLRPGFPLAEVKAIFNNDTYFDASCQIQDESLLIEAEELKKRIQDDNLKIISVIENQAISYPFPVDIRMPLSESGSFKTGIIFRRLK